MKKGADAMKKALEADGEKLRRLTGEDHGPWELSEYDQGEECGRWDNGRLTRSCTKAGSEECDFECLYRDSLYRGRP